MITQCATAQILEMITERTLVGPVVHKAATTWAQPVMPLCRPCLHHLRRLKPNFRRRRRNSVHVFRKQMLPLDSMLIQTIVPGVTRHHDLRTRTRMKRALSQTGNLYCKLFEAVATILAAPESSSNTPQAMHPWWEYNLRTEFFAHKSSARLIRLIGSSTPETG
jgi:hypothetical protein